MAHISNRLALGCLVVWAVGCTAAPGSHGSSGDDDDSGGAGGDTGGKSGSTSGGKAASQAKGGTSGDNKGGDTQGGAGGTKTGGGGSAGAAGGVGGTGSSNKGGTAGTAMATGGNGGKAPALMACTSLTATVRDFVATHPDFEFATGACAEMAVGCPGSGLGMVKPDLDAKKKPKLIGASFKDEMNFVQVKSSESFDQWWNDAPGINHTFERKFEVTMRSAALVQFGQEGYYPVDDVGFGNKDYVGGEVAPTAMIDMEDMLHNHLITVETHAEFLYEAGKNQIIITESDDDSWVFINGKLAIDNGGLHGFAPASGTLDPLANQLGLESGKRYPISFFFADRQMSGSSYRVSTNIKFTHCNK